jgi:hypothetical protein
MSENDVWWGPVNKPMSPEVCTLLLYAGIFWVPRTCRSFAIVLGCHRRKSVSFFFFFLILCDAPCMKVGVVCMPSLHPSFPPNDKLVFQSNFVDQKMFSLSIQHAFELCLTFNTFPPFSPAILSHLCSRFAPHATTTLANPG